MTSRRNFNFRSVGTWSHPWMLSRDDLLLLVALCTQAGGDRLQKRDFLKGFSSHFCTRMASNAPLLVVGWPSSKFLDNNLQIALLSSKSLSPTLIPWRCSNNRVCTEKETMEMFNSSPHSHKTKITKYMTRNNSLEHSLLHLPNKCNLTYLICAFKILVIYQSWSKHVMEELLHLTLSKHYSRHAEPHKYQYMERFSRPADPKSNLDNGCFLYIEKPHTIFVLSVW